MSVVVLNASIRVARKDHRCGLCWQTIVVGERYSVQKAADNGTVATHKAHLRCERFAVKVVDPFDWEYGLDTVSFGEYVRENEALAIEMGIVLEATP